MKTKLENNEKETTTHEINEQREKNEKSIWNYYVDFWWVCFWIKYVIFDHSLHKAEIFSILNEFHFTFAIINAKWKIGTFWFYTRINGRKLYWMCECFLSFHSLSILTLT